MDAETRQRLQDILDYLDRMQEAFGLSSNICQWGACSFPATTELRATPDAEPLRVCRGHELMLTAMQAGWREEGIL